MKLILKDILFSVLLKTGLISLNKLSVDKFYIVTFHRVLPVNLKKHYPFPGLVVTPEDLAWLLRIFSNYFICGAVSDLYSRWENGDVEEKPFLAVTFDDGQLDNYIYAKPVLERYGVKATFYVPTNAIDVGEILWHDRLGFSIISLIEKNPEAAFKILASIGFNKVSDYSSSKIARLVVSQAKMVKPDIRREWVMTFQEHAGIDIIPEWNSMMDWDLLSCLAQKGHEIGSHSISHNLLSQLSKEDVKTEIEGSRELIKEKLNIGVRSFCYPNGDYNDYVEKITGSSGYNNAVTTVYGSNKINHSYALKRFDMVIANIVDRENKLSIARLSWRLSVLFELWNK